MIGCGGCCEMVGLVMSCGGTDVVMWLVVVVVVRWSAWLCCVVVVMW